MTESIVRDPQVDGHWFVFIDGFQVGELWANEDETGWPVSYGYALGLTVESNFANLADAESTLIHTYKLLKLTTTAQLP